MFLLPPKVTVFALAIFLSTAMVGAQPLPDDEQEKAHPGSDTDTSIEIFINLLREFNCKCLADVNGFACEDSSLEDFKEYEWSHPDLVAFAERFRILYGRLRETRGKITLLLQGEADSQEILEYKLWGSVGAELGRREGRRDSDKVTNPDLAWLRSVAVLRALQALLPSQQDIKILEPVAYKSPDHVAGKYRATRIYIVDEEVGCFDIYEKQKGAQ